MGRLRASANRGVSSISLIHPEAIYDINFASGQWFGALPSDLVVSRASEALTLTAGGTYANFASNTARITGNGLLIEEARTNSIRNSRGNGAVAGTPGTAPTNWNAPVNPLAGVTREVVGLFSVDGLPVIRMRWSGTPSATSSFVALVTFEPTTQTAAAISQTWTTSASVALSGGSVSGATPILLDISERDGAGAGLVNSNTTISLTSSLTRFSHSRTLTNASTAFVISRLVVAFTSGVAVDFTLDIAAPQLSQASFALSPILNADGVTSSTTTRPADVVYLPISGVGLEYTIYAQTAVLESHVSSAALIEAWASSSDRIRPNISQTTQGGSVTSGGSSRSIAAFTAGSGAARKVAMRVQGGNIIVACNGSLGTADTGAAPTVAPSRLYFGSGAGGTAAFLNDELLRGAIIPRALSNAELQTLTT